MAITAAFENTATISTAEFSLVSNSTTLASNASAGVYQAFIDFSALTLTEVYEIKIAEKVTAAGVQRTISIATVQGPLAQPHYVTPSLILMRGWDVTVKKISGTDRAISWSIRQVA